MIKEITMIGDYSARYPNSDLPTFSPATAILDTSAESKKLKGESDYLHAKEFIGVLLPLLLSSTSELGLGGLRDYKIMMKNSNPRTLTHYIHTLHSLDLQPKQLPNVSL